MSDLPTRKTAWLATWAIGPLALCLGTAKPALAGDAFADLAAKVGGESLAPGILAQYGCPSGPLDLDAPARASTIQVIVNHMFVWSEIDATRSDGTPSICLRLEKPARRYLSPEETRLLLLGQHRLTTQAKALRARRTRSASASVNTVPGEKGLLPTIKSLGARPAQFDRGELKGSPDLSLSTLRGIVAHAKVNPSGDPIDPLDVDDPDTADESESIHIFRDNDTKAYPFQVVGSMLIQGNQGGVGICTGTLIAPRTVLTAGHCLYSLLDENSDLSDTPGFAVDAVFAPGQFTTEDAPEEPQTPFGTMTAAKVDAFRVLKAFTKADVDTWPNFDNAALITENEISDLDTYAPIRFSQADTTYNRLGYSGEVLGEPNQTLIGSYDAVTSTTTGVFEFKNDIDYMAPGVSGGPNLSYTASSDTYALDAVNSYVRAAGTVAGSARLQSEFQATIENWVAAGTGDGSGEVDEPEEPGQTIEIYRFYNILTGVHFYTASKTERDSVIANLTQYKYEQNAGFFAYAAGDSSAGAVPVYRFYNSVTGTHFYTANTNERDSIIANLPQYSYEGVAFNAFGTGEAGCTDKVFRFLNTSTGTHFYTSNLVERDVVRSTRQDMHYEGPVFCAAE